MIIGYSVEGSTDRAMLEGLRQRWCPHAEFIEGHFRGTTGQSRRREIPRICIELQNKNADCIIFLTDSDTADWRQLVKDETARCQPQHQHLTLFGVCLRNVECWLSSDRNYIALVTGRSANEFNVPDPKGIVESAFGISRGDKKEAEIAEFVRGAPLRNWLSNVSFEAFYKSVRRKSLELGCQIENLLD